MNVRNILSNLTYWLLGRRSWRRHHSMQWGWGKLCVEKVRVGLLQVGSICTWDQNCGATSIEQGADIRRLFASPFWARRTWLSKGVLRSVPPFLPSVMGELAATCCVLQQAPSLPGRRRTGYTGWPKFATIAMAMISCQWQPCQPESV